MYNNKLLTDKESKLFFKYTIPSITATLGLSLYVLADTYFVANGIGPIGLASLNIALPIFSLVYALSALIGVGGSTLMSIYKGRNKIDKLNNIFSMSIFNTAILGAIFLIVGLFFSEELALLFGATEATLPYVVTYLKVLLRLGPFMILNNVIVNFVRNDGKPRLAMAAMLLGTFSNIILDYIFIYIFHWGMFGAALATGGSPILSLIIMSTHFIRKHNTFKLEKFKYSFYILKRSIACGVSSFVSELSAGIVIFLFNMVLLKISGEIGVAAYGIIANIALVCMYIFNGLAQGMQPIISVNFGADKTERVRKIFLLGVSTALILGIIFYVLGVTFPAQIASLFNNQNSLELAKITIQGIKIYFIGFIFIGVNIVTISFYQSTLKTKQALILSLLRGCILIVVILFILSPLIGINGVWMVIPLTEIITFILSSILTIKYFKKNFER